MQSAYLRPLTAPGNAQSWRFVSLWGRSPQVRTHSFTAPPPNLRRLALITRGSWCLARSPCSATPSIRFLFIGSRFTLHASFPHLVALIVGKQVGVGLSVQPRPESVNKYHRFLGLLRFPQRLIVGCSITDLASNVASCQVPQTWFWSPLATWAVRSPGPLPASLISPKKTNCVGSSGVVGFRVRPVF
jgi:hypothetical protein